MHSAIQCTSDEILHESSIFKLPSWQIVQNTKTSKPKNHKKIEMQTDGNKTSLLKRKQYTVDSKQSSIKKIKLDDSNKNNNHNTITKAIPVIDITSHKYIHHIGTQWNSHNWSCAYDSLFFYNI